MAKLSNVEEMATQNEIFELWTKYWGLKVYPAYGIDKLKFSFVEKGQSGKGKSFDIYMNVAKDGAQCFDNWAYDILHGRFERVMVAEKNAEEKYPKAYKYVTGEKAEKGLGIMNSTTSGYCLNAYVPGKDGKTIFANVPVSFHDLRHIAERYQYSYEERKKELEDIRRAAVKAEQQKIAKAAAADKQSEQPATQAQSKPGNAPSTKQANPSSTGKEFNFKTVGQPTATAQGIVFPVSVNGSKQTGKLLFPADNQPSWLDQLIAASKQSQRVLNAIALQNGAFFTYLNVAKAS